ncbi:MAG: CRISPR-associated RAMP protein [Oscillochloris sp.]|nr:CRISPR-associated RAMP protein [Oscillochloris sp.]
MKEYTFETLRNRFTITGDLVARTALRVGSGRANNVVGNDLPVLRDALGEPLIPGASLKGLLRAQIETLVRALHPSQARDLNETEDVMREQVAGLRDAPELVELRRQGEGAKADARYTDNLLQRVCTLMDVTFGAPWLAGRLSISDARVDRSLWFGQYEVRNGVALNRDTETAEEGLLYDYEVVPAGTRFSFRLVLENAEPWQCGMLLLALQPWTRGEIQIGGFRTRGLGYVALEQAAYRFISVSSADDVLRMICDDATLDALEIAHADVLIDPDPTMEPARGWYQAFRAVLASGTLPLTTENNHA